ncbi:alpha/beta hydrolase [Paenibacillus frigoriresistens]|uniref:alpha/beta hydrolase n=1 Tax=Paenibacillus alginolyticus TaxID=59839 RepID=UPI0015656FE2|nr:alpha/beta hydrolase [Paenibacillus frigoriresistens]NRF95581.1 alpha/beta hydrolase [Paenibacillus frigoriresistens]
MRKQDSSEKTIQKSLITTKLFDRFWDRWFAHGIAEQGISELRIELNDVSQWVNGLNRQAVHYENTACSHAERRLIGEAEHYYRTAGLYFYLIQWIFPEAGTDKRHWFQRCKEMFKKADILSEIQTTEASIEVKERMCFGRVRVPKSAKGCVIIINPIDSSKEELFTYESDFTNSGFVTVNFDGPGQGETYISQSLKASQANWALFITQVIDYTASHFPDLPIFLFGTSSGAAWAIFGASHPKVSKAVSVSPACKSNSHLPEYFLERMDYILDVNADLLPALDDLSHCKPVMLFHGKKDLMVRDQDIYNLYDRLPEGKRLVEYGDEGHCCNFKLDEIRKISTEWFLEESKNDV